MIKLAFTLSLALVVNAAEEASNECAGIDCSGHGSLTGRGLLMVNKRLSLNMEMDETGADISNQSVHQTEGQETTKDIYLLGSTAAEARRPPCSKDTDTPYVHEVLPRTGSIAGGQRLFIKGCNLYPPHTHIGSSFQSPVLISMLQGNTDTGLKCDLDGFHSFNHQVTCVTRPINGDSTLMAMLGMKLEVQVKLLQKDDSYKVAPKCSDRRQCNMQYMYGAMHRGGRATMGPTPELTSVSNFLVTPGESVELLAATCNSKVWKDAIELRPVGKIQGKLNVGNSTNATDSASGVGDPAHAWVCQPEPASPSPQPDMGLRASYYKLQSNMRKRVKNWRNRQCDIADFGKITANSDALMLKEQVDFMYNTPREYYGVYWPGLEVMDWFAVQWEGRLIITQAGKYKFRISCDDNCDLQINGQLAVTSYCGGGWRQAEVQFSAGKHGVTIRFDESGGSARMQFEYLPPQARRWMPVPNSMLEPGQLVQSPAAQDSATGDVRMVRFLGGRGSGDNDCPGNVPKMNLAWKCKVPDDIPAETFYDIYFKDHVFGDSLIKAGARIPPMMGYEQAVIKVVPKVDSVLKIASGTKLMVLGNGLDSTNMSLSLDGQPCAITTHTQDRIECALSQSVAPSLGSSFPGARGFKHETYTFMQCNWESKHRRWYLNHDGAVLQVDDNLKFSSIGRFGNLQVNRTSKLASPVPTGACLHAARITGLWSPKYNGSYRLKMAWDGQVKARLHFKIEGQWKEVASSQKGRDAISQWLELSDVVGQEYPIRLEYIYVPKLGRSNMFKTLEVESRRMTLPPGMISPLPSEVQKVCAVFKEYSVKYDIAVPATGASSISLGSQSVSISGPDDVGPALAKLFGSPCRTPDAHPIKSMNFEPVGSAEVVRQVFASAGTDRRFGTNTAIASGSAACGLGSLYVDASRASWSGAMTPLPGGPLTLDSAPYLSFCYKIPSSTIANMVLKVKNNRRDDYVSIPLTYVPEAAGVPAYTQWPTCTKRGASVQIQNDGAWHCTGINLLTMFIDRWKSYEKRFRGINYRHQNRLARDLRKMQVTEIGFHAPSINYWSRAVGTMPQMQGEFWMDEISFSSAARAVTPMASTAAGLSPWSNITGIRAGAPSSGTGVQAEFFDNIPRPSRWPDFSKLTAAVSRTDQSVSYTRTRGSWPNLRFRDWFAARWNGKIIISKPGAYTFRLYSDEAARMFLETQAPVLPAVPAGHVRATVVQMGTDADFTLTARVKTAECSAHIMGKTFQSGLIAGYFPRSFGSSPKMLQVYRCKVCLNINSVGMPCGKTRVNDNKERMVSLSYIKAKQTYKLMLDGKEEFSWRLSRRDAQRAGPDSEDSRFDVNIDVSSRIRNGRLWRPSSRGKPYREFASFYLKDVKTGMCVHTQTRAANRGTKLVYWPGCGGTKNMLAKVEYNTSTFQLQNVKTGRCVHVGRRAPLVEYWDGCSADKNKMTKVAAGDGEAFYIKNAQTGLCLQAQGGNVGKGRRLVYSGGCGGANNKFVEAAAGLTSTGISVLGIKYNNQLVTAPLPPSVPVLKDEQGAAARGGALWLTPVVADKPSHSWRARSGTAQLSNGAHGFLVQYMERGSWAGVQFQYSGPDTAGRFIDVPASVLIYGAARSDGLAVVPVEILGKRPADAARIRNLLGSTKLVGTSSGAKVEERSPLGQLPLSNTMKVTKPGDQSPSSTGQEVDLDSDKYVQLGRILGGATVTDLPSPAGSECFRVAFTTPGDVEPVSFTGDILVSSSVEELASGVGSFPDVNDFYFRQPQASAPLSLMSDWRNYVCMGTDGCIPKEASNEDIQAIRATLLQKLPPSAMAQPQIQAARRNPHSHRKWRGPSRELERHDLDHLRKRVVGHSSTFMGDDTLSHVMALLQQAGGGRTHHSHRKAMASPYPPVPDPRGASVTKLRWSSNATWGGQKPPTSADLDLLYIPEGRTLLLDVPHIDIRFWVIEGNLIWDDSMDIKMEAEAIVINGGGLYIGSEIKPYAMKGEIVLNGHWHSPKLPICGMKTIFQTQGIVEMHGIPVQYTWTSLHETAVAGSSTLVLVDPVDWVPGDHIVIAPSDKAVSNCRSDRLDTCQVEEKKVTSVQKDVPSKGLATVMLDGPLMYRHVAEVIQAPNGQEVQIRAEVGKLNRNIKVRGSQPALGRTKYEIEEQAPLGPAGSEGYGGHMMLTDVGIIKYIEFNFMGQAFQMGRYPVHFHLSSLNPYSKAVGNAVWRTFNRAFTVHGIHKLTVERNVAYSTLGHTYFLEDGNEHHNLFADNLGMLTMPSFSLLASDMTPATFWTTNPHNTWLRNHAAGSHTFGFWFDLQGGVGHGAQSTQFVQLKQFENNTAHNNGNSGVWVGGMASGGHDPRFGCIPTTFDFQYTTGCGGRKRVYQEHVGTLTYMNDGQGYALVGTGHLALRNCVSVSEGTGHAYMGIVADEWSNMESSYSSGPINKANLFLASSTLPKTSGCGVSAPSTDYLFIKDDDFVDAFQKGSICGPGNPGFEFRTKGLHFHNEAAKTKVLLSQRDTIVWDEDGSVTSTEMCYLHGCYLHGVYGLANDTFGGMGHLPRGYCFPVTDSPNAMWCKKNLVLKTYRWLEVPIWAMQTTIGVHSQHGYSQSSWSPMPSKYVFTMFGGGKHKIVVENVPPSEIVDLEEFTGQAQGLFPGTSFVLMFETLTNPDHYVVDGGAMPLVPSIGIKAAIPNYNCSYDPNAYYEEAFGSNITNKPNMTCLPAQAGAEDAFSDDDFAGWYDLQRCGQCNDYCRWIGLSGSGGDPTVQMVHGSSYWSCRLSGSKLHYQKTNTDTPKGKYTMWPHRKCTTKGAEPPWKLALPAGTNGFYSDNPMSQNWFCEQMQLQNIFPKFPEAPGGSYIYKSASETHNMNFWHPGILAWTVSLIGKTPVKNLAGKPMDGVKPHRPFGQTMITTQPAVEQFWRRIEVSGGSLTRVATNSVTVKNVQIGMTVARGRDWKWGDEDGGSPAKDTYYVGEITAIDKSSLTVSVKWNKKEWKRGSYLIQTDDSSEPLSHYRLGKVESDGAKYDLYIANGTVQTRGEYLAAQCGITVAANTTTYRWSNASAWPSGAVPADEDNVTIPHGTTVILDVNSTAMLNELIVNGKLIFDDSGDRLVTARYVVIGPYTGVVTIGSKATPFQHKATVLLRGHRMTPNMRGVGRGSKFILVKGQLNAYGSRGTYVTRLLASVPVSSTSLNVDAAAAAKFKVGDQIVVTSTDRVHPKYSGADNHNELATITSISVDNGTARLSLSEPLKYAHKGLDDVPFGAGTEEFKGSLAAYIALAVPTGSIKIDSEDTEGPPMCGERCPTNEGLSGQSLARMATRFRDPAWLAAHGCRPCKANTDMNFGVSVYIVPTAGLGPTCPRTVGSVKLDSVSFQHCGQRNYVTRQCLIFTPPGQVSGQEKELEIFEKGRDWIDDPIHNLSPPEIEKPLGPATSFVVRCSFATSYMAALTVDSGSADQPVTITDNVMYGLRQHGIGVSSSQAVVERNLVAWVLDFNDKVDDGVWAYGMIAYGYPVARNNVLVGMEWGGAMIQTEPCGIANFKVTKNTVAGVPIGVIAQTAKECAEVNGWIILQTTGSGVRLDDEPRLAMADVGVGGGGTTYKYVNNLLIDNSLAISHMMTGVNGRTHKRTVFHASVEDSTFVGGPGSIGMSAPSWHGGGNLAGINTCSAANNNGPTLYGSGSLVNCRFFNFKNDQGSSAITNFDRGWVPHLTGQHYQLFVKGASFLQVDEEAKITFKRAGGFGGMALMSIGCAQFACDGYKASSIVDQDGSLIGGSGGTVVGRNEQDFYKRLGYVDPLGFESMEDLIPFAQRYDMNGKAIPLPLNVSDLVPGVGQHAKRYGRVDTGFGGHGDTTRSPELAGPVYKEPGFYRNDECRLQSAWNAWLCPEGLHRDLIIEVMDYNFLVRRWAPVTVEVNDNYRAQGGFLSMFTGDARYEWTSQDRLSTFHGLGYVGMRHNVYLSGSPPNHIRMHWRGQTEDEGIVACFYYGLPNTVNVYVDGNLVQPKTVTTWDNFFIPTLNISMSHGTNFYDRVGVETGRPGYLYVVMKGINSFVDLKVSHKVKLTSKISLNSNLTFGGDGKVKRSAYWEKGINGLVRSIALQFGIPPNRISIVGNGTAKPGTFWNENTTSASFAKWMWKQNQTMDKMNRTRLTNEMKHLQSTTGSPSTPGRDTSMLEMDPETIHSQLQRFQKSAKDHLALIDEYETTYQKAAQTELKEEVVNLADEVRKCAEKPNMEELQKCIGNAQLHSEVTKAEGRIKGALTSYFADKAKIAQMAQWQDDNTKSCKQDDSVEARDPCAIGQQQLPGVLEAEASAKSMLDTSKVDVVIDPEVPDEDLESGNTISADSQSGKQSTIDLASKIAGSKCSKTAAADCQPAVCPLGEICTPFKVDDLQVDGNIGNVPPGWTCAVDRYGSGDQCDCECGVWDPDCEDTTVDFRQSLFGIRDDDETSIWLLDSEGVNHLFRVIDANGNFEIDGMELQKGEVFLGSNNRLVNMGKQISGARRNLLGKLLWSTSPNCMTPFDDEVKQLDKILDSEVVTYKAMCVKDEVRQVEGKAAGRCAWLPEFKPGAQCLVTAGQPNFWPKLGNPCDGDECVASNLNTWEYTCGQDTLEQEDLEPGFVFEIFKRRAEKAGENEVGPNRRRRRRRFGDIASIWEQATDLPAAPKAKIVIKPKSAGGDEDFFRTPRRGDWFLGRVRGRFLADVTGNYKFFLMADQSGLLRIRLESGKLVTIASAPRATRSFTQYTEQTSENVYLQAGTLADLEGLYVDTRGGDFISIGCELPGGQVYKPCPLEHRIMLPKDAMTSATPAQIRAQAALLGDIEGTFQKDNSEAAVVIPDLDHDTGAAGKLTLKFVCKEPTKVYYLRIRNGGYTGWRPAVDEVQLFSDTACTASITIPARGGWNAIPGDCPSNGCNLCSGAKKQDEGCHLAIDNDGSSSWRPNCHPCQPGSIHMTFRLSQSTVVRCVKAGGMGSGSGGGKSWNGGLDVLTSVDAANWTPLTKDDTLSGTDMNTYVVLQQQGLELLDLSNGLVLDLQGDKYNNSGTWENQVAGGPSANVPKGVTFDATLHAFQLSSAQALTVNLATSPDAMPEATYAIWVKVSGHLKDGAWVMSQKPDYGWSRAVALNEHSSGGITITKGGHWKANLGYPSPGQWMHIVGVFRQGQKCTVYKNGLQGLETTCNNGRSADPREMLMIGNADVMVSDVKVFKRALSDEEVRALYNAGNRPAIEALQSATVTSAPVPIAFAAEVLAPSEFTNSFFVYLDGKQNEAEMWQFGITDEYVKSALSPIFMVGTGQHTLTIQGREDNIKIRNLYMSYGQDCEWEDVPASE